MNLPYAGTLWDCDAMKPCAGKRRSPEAAAPKAETIEPKAETKEVVCETEKTMHVKGTKVPRISEEVKAAIRAADPSISNRTLAAQFKCSENSVWLIRKRAGVKGSSCPGPHSRGTKPARGIAPTSAIAPSAEKIRRVLDKHLEPFPRVPFTAAKPNESQPSSQITVTICSAISNERAASIFAALAPHLKAIALQAGLQAALEEA